MCIVVKLKPQVPEYKEVQIVLSSTPVEEQTATTEQAAATEQTAVPEPVEGPAVEQPAVVEPVETTKPAETKKVVSTSSTTTSSAKTTTTQPKKEYTKVTEPETYGTFLGDEIDFGTKNKSTSNVNWDNMFDDSGSDQEPAVSQKVDKVTTASSTSGSAASTSTSSQRQTSSSSSSGSSQTSAPAASSSTNDAANAIKNTTSASSSSGSATGISDVQKFSSDLDITWNGGDARKAKGALSINLTTGSSIKEKKTTVKIEFEVGEDGYVTPGTVKIIPESLLPEVVRKEVISQINLWRFNEGSSRSKATFEYTIIKKD